MKLFITAVLCCVLLLTRLPLFLLLILSLSHFLLLALIDVMSLFIVLGYLNCTNFRFFLHIVDVMMFTANLLFDLRSPCTLLIIQFTVKCSVPQLDFETNHSLTQMLIQLGESSIFVFEVINSHPLVIQLALVERLGQLLLFLNCTKLSLQASYKLCHLRSLIVIIVLLATHERHIPSLSLC